jgi:hypothetical protein
MSKLSAEENPENYIEAAAEKAIEVLNEEESDNGQEEFGEYSALTDAL